MPSAVIAQPVLGNIEQILEKALARLAEREQAALPPLPVEDREAAWRDLQRRLEARPDGLEGVARHAEQAAASADETLAACADAATRWLQAATETRQKLAEWAGRSV